VDYSKQSLWSIRGGFVFFAGILGVALCPPATNSLTAFLSGAAIGAVSVASELWLRRQPFKALISASLGMLLGMLGGMLLILNLGQTGLLNSGFWHLLRPLVPIGGAYLGFAIGLSKQGSSGSSLFDWSASSGQASYIDSKILDTSVLIDGRIVEIAEAGFLDGRLLVPQFVLHELQTIADSSDSARRNRGRRGLDVVSQLQKTPDLFVEVIAQDFPNIREVDLKLIQLAKSSVAKIVTNDFNLNKLAQVQGIRVLNINELANSVKPVVLPGEAMRVFILKEGKEHNQGVAYLDDGTMVVVDNARRLISKTIDITVTSVLQTTAGKMIFGKYDERQSMAEHRGSPVVTAASTGTS
jgi:uncharacterized protein YacL